MSTRKNDNLSRLLIGLKGAGVDKGVRNKTVAEKTGYSVGTINRILSDNAVLTDRFIMAVCRAFGINEKWILKGEEPVLRLIPTNDWTGRSPVVFEGQRLGEIREALGYSLDEMADLLNTDVNNVQQREQDLFIKDTQLLRNLALIGININWLFTGRGDMRLDQWPVTITGRDGRSFDIDELFAIRLRTELGQRSTEWLARESNIDQKKVEMFISGESVPTVTQLSAMADTLGVTAKWLTTTNNRDLWEKLVYEKLKKTDIAINAELYKAALIAIESFLNEAALLTSVEKKADMINFLCRMHIKESPDSKEINREMVRQIVRLAT